MNCKVVFHTCLLIVCVQHSACANQKTESFKIARAMWLALRSRERWRRKLFAGIWSPKRPWRCQYQCINPNFQHPWFLVGWHTAWHQRGHQWVCCSQVLTKLDLTTALPGGRGTWREEDKRWFSRQERKLFVWANSVKALEICQKRFSYGDDQEDLLDTSSITLTSSNLKLNYIELKPFDIYRCQNYWVRHVVVSKNQAFLSFVAMPAGEGSVEMRCAWHRMEILAFRSGEAAMQNRRPESLDWSKWWKSYETKWNWKSLGLNACWNDYLRRSLSCWLRVLCFSSVASEFMEDRSDASLRILHRLPFPLGALKKEPPMKKVSPRRSHLKDKLGFFVQL